MLGQFLKSSIINFLENQIMNFFGDYIFSIDLSDIKNKTIKNIVINKEVFNQLIFNDSVIQLESFQINSIILDEILLKKKVFKIKVKGVNLELYINQDICNPIIKKPEQQQDNNQNLNYLKQYDFEIQIEDISTKVYFTPKVEEDSYFEVIIKKIAVENKDIIQENANKIQKQIKIHNLGIFFIESKTMYWRIFSCDQIVEMSILLDLETIQPSFSFNVKIKHLIFQFTQETLLHILIYIQKSSNFNNYQLAYSFLNQLQQKKDNNNLQSKKNSSKIFLDINCQFQNIHFNIISETAAIKLEQTVFKNSCKLDEYYEYIVNDYIQIQIQDLQILCNKEDVKINLQFIKFLFFKCIEQLDDMEFKDFSSSNFEKFNLICIQNEDKKLLFLREKTIDLELQNIQVQIKHFFLLQNFLKELLLSKIFDKGQTKNQYTFLEKQFYQKNFYQFNVQEFEQQIRDFVNKDQINLLKLSQNIKVFIKEISIKDDIELLKLQNIQFSNRNQNLLKIDLVRVLDIFDIESINVNNEYSIFKQKSTLKISIKKFENIIEVQNLQKLLSLINRKKIFQDFFNTVQTLNTFLDDLKNYKEKNTNRIYLNNLLALNIQRMGPQVKFLFDYLVIEFKNIKLQLIDVMNVDSLNDILYQKGQQTEFIEFEDTERINKIIIFELTFKSANIQVNDVTKFKIVDPQVKFLKFIKIDNDDPLFQISTNQIKGLQQKQKLSIEFQLDINVNNSYQKINQFQNYVNMNILLIIPKIQNIINENVLKKEVQQSESEQQQEFFDIQFESKCTIITLNINLLTYQIKVKNILASMQLLKFDQIEVKKLNLINKKNNFTIMNIDKSQVIISKGFNCLVGTIQLNIKSNILNDIQEIADINQKIFDIIISTLDQLQFNCIQDEELDSKQPSIFESFLRESKNRICIEDFVDIFGFDLSSEKFNNQLCKNNNRNQTFDEFFQQYSGLDTKQYIKISIQNINAKIIDEIYGDSFNDVKEFTIDANLQKIYFISNLSQEYLIVDNFKASIDYKQKNQELIYHDNNQYFLKIYLDRNIEKSYKNIFFKMANLNIKITSNIVNLLEKKVQQMMKNLEKFEHSEIEEEIQKEKIDLLYFREILIEQQLVYLRIAKTKFEFKFQKLDLSYLENQPIDVFTSEILKSITNSISKSLKKAHVKSYINLSFFIIWRLVKFILQKKNIRKATRFLKSKILNQQ